MALGDSLLPLMVWSILEKVRKGELLTARQKRIYEAFKKAEEDNDNDSV